MYGDYSYASAPYADVGSSYVILIAACINIDDQLVYECEIGTSQVYIATVLSELINNTSSSTSSDGAEISASAVYLIDVKAEGAC